MNIQEDLLSAMTETRTALIDRWVIDHPHGYAYHRPAWSQAIRLAYGFDASVLTATTSELLAGVLIATHHRGLSMRGSLCTLPYCDFAGALTLGAEVERRLIDAASGLVRRRSARGMQLRALKTGATTPTQGEKVSMQMTLPSSREALMSGYKAKLRSQIRKASKNGLWFEAGRGQSFIDRFYEVYARNMRDLGSPPHAKAWYEALDVSFGEDILIGLVHSKSTCIGVGLLLFSGNNVSIPWASTLREFNRLAPNMLLYAELLNQSIDRRCERFDFGRSDMGGGTFRFKRQWGAEPSQLQWLDWDKRASRWHTVSNRAGAGRARLASIWQRLPVPVSTLLGAKLRRYLSL